MAHASLVQAPCLTILTVGCGKSTLASIIIDSLEKGPPDAANNACVYVYFSNSEEQQQFHFADIFISLTLQLIHRGGDSSIETLRSIYNNRRYGKVFHVGDDYVDMFAAQTTAFDKVFLVFDALDNCDNSTKERTRELLQKAIIKQLPSNVKVLATSRWAPSGLWKREGSKELAVKADQADLAAYVQDRIDSHGHMQGLINEHPDANFKMTVTEKVVQATGGMFLLAKLHMDKLSEQWMLGDFKSTLNQLHTSISKVFEDSVQRIQSLKTDPEPKKYELAQHILTWVIYAATPMTMDNLRHSFALKYSPKDTLNLEFCPSESLIMDVCAGLVVKDAEISCLHLIHPSVREYIRKHGIILQRPDKSMACTCFTYLQLQEFTVQVDTKDAVRARLSQYPLLEYATRNWPAHLRRAERLQDPDSDSLYGLALKFLGSKPMVTSSFGAVEVANSVFSNTADINGLHLATFFNLPGLIDRLVAQDPQLVNSPCSNGETALHWAVRCPDDGKNTTVQVLLSHSADPNIQDNHGNTPLHGLVMAPVPQTAETTTPLTARGNLVKQLIQAGAQAMIRNKNGLTPLRSATSGSPSIATILIGSLTRADLDTPDGHGWTPLWDALHYRQLEIAGLLLKAGANPNRPSRDGGWTPLLRAAQAGHQETIHLLCQNGADVNLTTPEKGYSALRWALAHKHTKVAQQLIQYGADIETKAVDGSTAFISAAQNGDEDMVWTLIQAGAKLDVQDNHGASALHYAAMSENRSIVWLLVMRGADLSLRDNQGLGVLDWAVQRGNFSMVWLLVESGGHQLLTSTAASGMNVLHRAANLGHAEIVRFLLSRGGPSPDEKDGEDMTPMHYAVSQKRDEVVRILTEHGVKLDVRGNRGMTPLVLAASQRNLGIMRTLLDRGASPDVQDNIGLTALHYAANSAVAFPEGLELLLKDSKNPNLKENALGLTALHLAVCSRHTGLVMLFKSRKGQELGGDGRQPVDVDVQDAEGRTALMLAAGQGNDMMTFYLTQRQGARLDLKDKHGKKALDYAKDHPSTAKWLDWK